MTRSPRRPVIGAQAPTWTSTPDTAARYWVVTHRGTRYWVGPAQGPAAHVYQAQAQALAERLHLEPRPPRPRRPRARSAQKGSE